MMRSETSVEADGVTMRVAIVENMDNTHHGQVGIALHEAGALIDVYRPYLGQPLPRTPAQHDAIVVLGGEQSAVDDRQHPYLPHLADLMRAHTEADRAVLGICLGSQILARGLGAENHLAAAHEFGWQQVALTDAARTDPVLSAIPPTFRSFQWHTDTFTLPPGAAHLAQSGIAPIQAFRAGRATYGMQFHFEANRAVVASWKALAPDWIDAHHPEFLSNHAELAARHGPAADATGLTIARAWVAQIVG